MENIKYRNTIAIVAILSAWFIGLALFGLAWYWVLRCAIGLTVLASYLIG